MGGGFIRISEGLTGLSDYFDPLHLNRLHTTNQHQQIRLFNQRTCLRDSEDLQRWRPGRSSQQGWHSVKCAESTQRSTAVRPVLCDSGSSYMFEWDETDHQLLSSMLQDSQGYAFFFCWGNPRLTNRIMRDGQCRSWTIFSSTQTAIDRE